MSCRFISSFLSNSSWFGIPVFEMVNFRRGWWRSHSHRILCRIETPSDCPRSLRGLHEG